MMIYFMYLRYCISRVSPPSVHNNVAYVCVFSVLFCLKDTLQWRVPDVIPWHCGGVEAHGAGELAHELVLEVLSALILLTSVDKHLVLKRCEISGC